MSAIKFSAIILNYNHGHCVVSALDTAIGQSRPFDEIIVIDDASTDESVAIIQNRIRDVPRVRFVQSPKNLGVVASSNLGLQQATGDFVFFMAADDRYNLRLIEWCDAVLLKYPDVVMISGNTRICFEKTSKERVFKLPFPQELSRHTCGDIEARHRAFTFNMGANMMRRDALLAAGQFTPALRWHSDWFLYLLLASRAAFAFVPEEFVSVRHAEDQYSHACFDWRQQKPVIEAFIRMLEDKYPHDYKFFRRCALLPTYDLEALMLWPVNASFRRYLTPLLFWRLLTYKFLRVMSKYCPDGLRASMRRLVRM